MSQRSDSNKQNSLECDVAEKLPWRSTSCTATRRKGMRLDVQSNTAGITLEDLITVVIKMGKLQEMGNTQVK
ncbi:hypothetical protein J6590_090096 [Homalodisca vitripennis]|nr:hypothetical protein J6590_090096 [Homalodisca vitripennis]